MTLCKGRNVVKLFKNVFKSKSFIAKLFSQMLQILLINYLRKMLDYPQFSFWISITLVKICFSRIFSKPSKNTFELVGTVLNKGSFQQTLVRKERVMKTLKKSRFYTLKLLAEKLCV